jgi:hypothetical protein
LQNITVFQPVAAIERLQATFEPFLRQLLPILRWQAPVGFLFWNIVAASGRNVVLRRLDPALTARWGTLLVLGILRSATLIAAWAVWMWGVRWSLGFAITGPAARGEDPSLVVFCALLICGTLGIYVAWAAVSWPLQLAPLLAMVQNKGAGASLVAALRGGPVRGKLLEINLVMCIVRLTLIVLAMVWSASPLAFQSVATDQFFAIWWAIAVPLYMASSDYFHVVRAAAYLRLWRAYNSADRT